MSKRAYITRYQLILNKLKSKPYCTLEEIQQFVTRQLEYRQEQDDTLKIGFSSRTFQRDIREIRSSFGVDIEYSKKEKGYYIHSGDMDTLNFERRMEAFDTFNALNLTRDLSAYIILEKRRPQGTEQIYSLLHAIKNRRQIEFSYHKFIDEEAGKRSVHPFALKEFSNRWYLMAKDLKDDKLKSFALDRMSELEPGTKKFVYPNDTDIDNYYRHCFGIICPEEGDPQEILLSFTPLQGKYIKTLPLHETQEIIVDNNSELRIRLKVHITYDFIMELLSFGENLRVLEPEELVKLVKGRHDAATLRYKEE